MENNLTMVVQIKSRNYPNTVETTTSITIGNNAYSKRMRLNEVIRHYLNSRESNLDLLPFLIINVIYLDSNGEVVEKKIDTKVQP